MELARPRGGRSYVISTSKNTTANHARLVEKQSMYAHRPAPCSRRTDLAIAVGRYSSNGRRRAAGAGLRARGDGLAGQQEVASDPESIIPHLRPPLTTSGRRRMTFLVAG